MTGALVDLSGLTAPATKLVEKVADALTGFARPWQIERVARAEARSDVIRAEARMEISELERRGLERMVREEGRKQENIESITFQAASKLDDKSQPDLLEMDWITHFFEHARLISEEDAQKIWVNLLAQECQSPNSVSKKTINIVSTLERRDAELFEQIVQFSINYGGIKICIADIEDDIFGKSGINFESAMHLEDIGLIKFNILSGFSLAQLPKYVEIEYFDTKFPLTFPQDSNNRFEIGKIYLTAAGLELAKIIERKENAEYLKYIENLLNDRGVLDRKRRTIQLNLLSKKFGLS